MQKNEFLCSEDSQRLVAAGAVSRQFLRQFLRQSWKRSLGQVTGESQMSFKILIGVVWELYGASLLELYDVLT